MKKEIKQNKKRNEILDFIKKNPKTTYKEIRKELKIHPERIFKNGLKQAFEEAEVKFPRTFEIKTIEQKKKIIIDYIKKNPLAGGQAIKKDTKINFHEFFSTSKEAFEAAKIKYPHEKNYIDKKEKKKIIIKEIIKNPLISTKEILQKTKIALHSAFKNMEEAYEEAGVEYIKKHEKRNIKKQNQIITYIKKNKLATQREINKSCKTHVQGIFNRGIFEAYEKAGIDFPFKRLKLYGVGLKEIRKRAKNFEDEISLNLSGYGNITRFLKTKRGVADIILERKGERVVVEVKDYQNKEISYSQIKQLIKYLEDCNCKLGFLVCHTKPKRDRFLIGETKIVVLEKTELNKVPKIIDGSVG
jgi:hypothetical protein